MRPLVLALPALAACSPDLVGGPDPTHDLAPLLVDDASSALPERVRTLDATPGSLIPGGDLLDGEPWPGTHEWVVGDPAEDAVAVLWESPIVQVGVWLDRGDLDRVAADWTWVGGRPDGAPGVRLPPGTSVDEQGRRDGRIAVQASNGAVHADGWVRASHVDEVWVTDTPEPAFDTDGSLGEILPDVALLDGPGGELLGTTALDGGTQSVWMGARDGAHVRVRWSAAGWPVDAWVHEDDVRPTRFGRGGGTWGCGCSGGFGLRGPPNVRADAWLRVEPAGAVVGRVRRDAWLDLDGTPGDWQVALVETPFGTAPLWVDPADVLLP